MSTHRRVQLRDQAHDCAISGATLGMSTELEGPHTEEGSCAIKAIGHAATGSRNVRLHVHTGHSFRPKVRPQKTAFPCNLRNTFREL